MSHSLIVQAQGAVPLSVAQLRFNQGVAHVSELSQTLARLLQWESQYRQPHLQAIYALQQHTDGVRKKVLFHLHERMQSTDLTRSQQRMLHQQIRRCIDQLGPADDPHIQAIAQHYPLDPDVHTAVQEAMDASERFWQRHLQSWSHHQQRLARKTAKRAARKALHRPQAHLRAEQRKADAQTMLRTLYRHLASALHPDREMDHDVRRMKNDWMGQVNTAYARKDLAALLRLQGQVHQLDLSRAVAVDDHTLNTMSSLLQAQVQDLEREVSTLKQRLAQELGVAVCLTSTEQELIQALDVAQGSYRDVLYQLSSDLQRIQQDQEFKRWLKEQSAQAKQQARSG